MPIQNVGATTPQLSYQPGGGRAGVNASLQHLRTGRTGAETEVQPRRTAPFDVEPGYYPAGQIWLYGNVKLLHGDLAHVSAACGLPIHRPYELDAIEREAEEYVLNSKVLICGIHNPAHQRAAIVPLRWGAPRILVLSGGFRHHLGIELKDEPFRAARLWRYNFDPRTDLVISRRAPDKKPTFAHHNPTVDRMIRLLAFGEHPGLSSPLDSLTPIPR